MNIVVPSLVVYLKTLKGIESMTTYVLLIFLFINGDIASEKVTFKDDLACEVAMDSIRATFKREGRMGTVTCIKVR